jgi:ribonuclease P protein component
MQYTVSLKLNHVFQRLYRKGVRSAMPTLALYSRPNGRKENRLGLTTGAKLGHAVVRNKLRRRLRAIYRIHEAEFRTGFDIVVVCRAAAVDASYQRLEREFLKLARKNGLLREKKSDPTGKPEKP